MSLQKESEWELKLQEKIKENNFVTPSSHLDVEEIKSFIRETLSNREKEIAEEVPNALHEYARWILTDGKYATPLQRRSKKKEITLQLLKH